MHTWISRWGAAIPEVAGIPKHAALTLIGGRTRMDDVRADTGACSYKIGSCNPFKLQEYRGSSMQQRWRIREGARRSTSTTKAALPGPSLQVSFTFSVSLLRRSIRIHRAAFKVFSAPSILTKHVHIELLKNGYGEVALRRLVPRAR